VRAQVLTAPVRTGFRVVECAAVQMGVFQCALKGAMGVTHGSCRRVDSVCDRVSSEADSVSFFRPSKRFHLVNVRNSSRGRGVEFP
jgi:hypothetical protein